MALYRPASRRPLIAVAAVGLVAGLVIGFLGARATAPGVADVINGLRDRTGDVSSALEVVRVHYPEVLAGTGGALSAAQALERAQTSFAAVEADLALIDPVAADAAYDALQALDGLIDAAAPVEQVAAAIDAVIEQLESIITSGGGQ